MQRNRAAAVSGLFAIVLMAGAVLSLGPIDGAYQLDDLDRWVRSSHDEPLATTLAAWGFATGLLGSLGLYAGLVTSSGRRDRGRWAVGAALVGGAALLDAAASLGPFVAIATISEMGSAMGLSRTLFATALAVDALHNLAIGLAFFVWWPTYQKLEPSTPWRALHVIAGGLMFIAGFQALVPATATAVLIGGPFWLAWLGRMSWHLWSGPVGRHAPAQPKTSGSENETN